MRQFSPGRRLRAATLAVASIGAVALAATPAQAALPSVGSCQAATTSQPFAQWGDTNDYVLAPGGAFSGDTTSWSLSNGAALESGGEPYNVSATDSPSAVTLPAGASAQSPFTCIDASYPTFRFFDVRTGSRGLMLVQLVYQSPLVGHVTIPVGTVRPSGDWLPSPVLLTGQGLPTALIGGQAQVALRFTELTGGSQIDDVFIDPRMRG